MRTRLALLTLVVSLAMAPTVGPASKGIFFTKAWAGTSSYGDQTYSQYTDAELVKLQEQYPGTYTNFQFTDIPLGSPVWDALKTVVNTLQASDPSARICLAFRPDLQYKFSEGATGTRWVGGSSVRYCPATTPNNCTNWGGNLTTCQGGSNPGDRCNVGDSTCTGGGTCGAADELFDTDWIMRTPIAEWDSIITNRWAGEDPFDGGTVAWNSQVDQSAYNALVTASDVPALYGTRNGSNLMVINQVVLDLRHEEARAWKAKEAVQRLQDAGITGTEPGCLFIGYKPGWYARYNGAGAYDTCRDPADRTYAGYMWGASPPGGCTQLGPMPLQDTQYGTGEFEDAINDFMSKLDADLTAAGMTNVKILVQEAPESDREWAPVQVLFGNPRFLGEIVPLTSDPFP